jgi:hypothetical protein
MSNIFKKNQQILKAAGKLPPDSESEILGYPNIKDKDKTWGYCCPVGL